MDLEPYREKLDRYIRLLSLAMPEDSNGHRPLAIQLRKDVKEFAVLALEGMLKEVEQYGRSTFTYDCARSFLVEFRNKI